jgi:membrane dipeptidase
VDHIFIADAHCDTLSKMLEEDMLLDASRGDSHPWHISIDKLKKGNVKVQIFAAWVAGPKHRPFAQQGMKLVDTYHQMLEHPLSPFVHLTKENIHHVLHTSEKIGTILSLEGGEALEGEIFNLRNFYRLGVRLLTLTWNHRNEIGDGVSETQSNGGLSQFGLKVIHEMNRLRMIVDVSHLNYRGFWDVIEHSVLPIMASHSNAKSIWDHPRNLDNDQINAIIQTKGFIGINFYPGFLEEKDSDVESIIKHIDHIVSLGGLEHVGFGSDFDGINETPKGIDGPQDYYRIIEALSRIGYRDEDIKKISANNLLRYVENFL